MRFIPVSGRAALLGATALAALVANSAGARAQFVAGDLLVSESTYADVGQAASLTVNTAHPSQSTALPGGGKAVSNGSYLTVWNNATPDSSFGVSSEITIDQITPTGSLVSSLNIPTSQVVTSFSSKSELGLTLSANGQAVTFVAYGDLQTPSGTPITNTLGVLDISNSNTPGIQDSTNPVQNVVAARTIVQINANGSITYTPTNAYPGNNGRNVVLASNGLYYMVGNSNNGTTTTSNQITTHTGLEVVTPMNSLTANVTPETPTQIDNSYVSISGDKFGKDSNFRGVTVYDGNLYFTKGSGSNGIDTVYTASNPNGQLPTPATAQQSSISVVNGFSTAHAKTSADYTPFATFFANSTTMYVTDEGSGDATDASQHAGLEKWSLVNGTWELDYTLQAGLIGETYTVSGTNSGVAGTWPTVTTTGLRNMTGVVNANGTVTIYAETSTSSASGDNGADPNELVAITDTLADTTLPTNEDFSTVIGPEYGTVIRGVSLTPVPEPASFALLGAGLAGLGAIRRRRG